MRDGHCHSHQVVFETAGGVCPQKVLRIIANICLHVHMYGFACTHMHSVCVLRFISECASTLLVSAVLWLSLSTRDYLYLFVFCVSMLWAVRKV